MPNFATATQKIKDEHAERVEKLFCCLMNYIHTSSELYKEAMREYNNDGILLYQRAQAVGTITIPQRVKDAYDDTWKRMTFENSRVRYNFNGIFNWAEKVQAQGRLLNKNANEMREKFVSGLPSFCDTFRTNMQKDTTYVYPALYGAIPGFAKHPKATQAHPFAGQPDINSLAKGYFAQWCVAVSNSSKFTPDGFAKVVCSEVDDDESNEWINLMSSEVNEDTICTHCGKAGHAASQWLKNGMLLVCTNKVLSKEHPNTYKSSGSSSAKQIVDPALMITQMQQMDEHIHALQDYIADMEKSFASKLQHVKRSRMTKRPSTPPPMQSYGASETEEDSTFEQEHDDDDNDSASSAVGPSDFADAAIQRKFKQLRDKPRLKPSRSR